MADKSKKNPSKELSTRKKTLFYVITFSIPILFFVFLEVGLRLADYKGNNALFLDPGIKNGEYLMPNQNFASRYFFYTNTIPNPSTDFFLAEKPDNGFRVFAMGGSSAAGYPYGFNGSFSRVVSDIFQDAMPDRKVEFVNVGVSAVNSYTLFDQVDEIIDQEPDAIMIYAGHNEFYGAFGVGSNESIGGFPGFVRLYLKLQRMKTFMLMRSAMVDAGKWISSNISGEEYNEAATLMERIVDSRSIELGSPKHELAMIQFQTNLNAIIKKYQKAGVPVFIGSVASNLKDQSPFVDIHDGDQPSAQAIYEEALSVYEAGSNVEAKELFVQARDLDGLKFRAPSEINEIIESTTKENDGVYYVPVEENLAANSENGIIGFELMLEHLHPNQKGFFLIGKSYSESMLDYYKIDLSELPKSLDSYFDDMQMTEFDDLIAYHRVKTLKQGFPFVLGDKPIPYQANYKTKSVADSLAFRAVHVGLNWDEAKVELAANYQAENDIDKAIDEYLGLIRNQPWNESHIIFAARLYLSKNDFNSAESFLKDAFEINPNDAFVTKMLGSIEVQKGNAKEGIRYLELSKQINPRDPQMLYNLSGAYGLNQQFDKALEIALMVREINANYPGNDAWIQQIQNILNR